MQLRIYGYCKGSMPLHEIHRNIQGAIYKAASIDAEYAQKLHSWDGGSGRKFKGFTFGALEGDVHRSNGQMRMNGMVAFEVRGYDEKLIDVLSSSWKTDKKAELGKNHLEITDVCISDEKHFLSSCEIELVSPVVAYTTGECRHTTFFSPLDEEFYDLIKHNAQRKAMFFLGEEKQINITPLFSVPPKQDFIVFKGTYIRAWYGKYRLDGDRELINLLYDAGIGAKNSQGFGMFRIIGGSI